MLAKLEIPRIIEPVPGTHGAAHGKIRLAVRWWDAIGGETQCCWGEHGTLHHELPRLKS